MSDPITLTDLSGTYRRVSSRIYRILEDGYDFAVGHLIIDTLNLDALIVDAAFFVLIFGQLEQRVNDLAMRCFDGDNRSRQAMRGAKFEKRLEVALPGLRYKVLRKEVSQWYDIRSDAAHGERFAYGYNVATVFERAFELDELVRRQSGDASSDGV